MTPAIAHYLPKQMAILGLVEGALSFGAICFVVLTGAASLPDNQPTAACITGQIGVALGLTVIIFGVALTTGLYRADVGLDPRRLMSAGLVAFPLFGLLLLVGCASLSRPHTAQFVLVIQLLAGWGTAIGSVRLIHIRLLGRRSLARRVLLVGDTDGMSPLHHRVMALAGPSFEPVLLHELDWSWAELRRRRIWAVVLILEDAGRFKPTLLDCKLRGMRILTAAMFLENCLGRIDIDALTESDLITGGGFQTGWASNAVKRLSDIVLATVLILLTLPLMLIIATAIKADSAGPVLYAQQRVGRFGTPFTLLKFRSMTTNAEAGGTPRWAQRQDPRVTRVGRFIRTTRIDELPQLVNVLCGEMSLVGPRPERPHFVQQLERAIPCYQHRSYVKPGLTGWAQVNFPYGASVEDAREKLAYDLYYVKNRSFLLDIATLFATIRVVLRGEGAR